MIKYKIFPFFLFMLSSSCGVCQAKEVEREDIMNPRIAIVSLDSDCFSNDSMDERMIRLTKSIENAVLDEPDLVLLPEACLTGLAALDQKNIFLGGGDKYYLKFSELAVDHKIFIAAAVLYNDGEQYHNSVLVFNPKGEMEYVYHKSYLTPSELAAGMIPGNPNQKCWNAPWGRTAFVICYDLNFNPLFENYRRQHAELLLFSSFFPGGMVLQQRALSLRAFAASSHGHGNESVFVDRAGREFARTNKLDPVITRRICLNSMLIRYEPAKFRKVKEQYGASVEIESLRPEGFSIICAPELKVEVGEIVKSFNLIELDKWFVESEAANAAKRK